MPHETTYMLGLIDGSLTVARPERLIDDKAYNNDPLDGQCTRRCIAMIAPQRANRTKPTTQGGRVLAVTRTGGRWSAFSHGFRTTAVSSPTMSVNSKTSSLFFRSPPS